MSSNIARETGITRIVESEQVREGLRRHVDEIIEGPAFRGSARSGQFLRHVLEEAIAGNFCALKERSIGVTLFGRAPSYPTGEDAIVRVTANDVRKRLLQHYDRRPAASEFHIHLPVGSYVPEVEYIPQATESALDVPAFGAPPRPSLVSHPTAAQFSGSAASGPVTGVAEPAALETPLSGRSRGRWLSTGRLFVVANLVLSGMLLYAVIWVRSSHTEAAAAAAGNRVEPAPVLPWSVIFGSGIPLHLITSDPDIYWIQMITHSQISPVDYANHIYIPDHNSLTPEMKQICLRTLRGDKAATIDSRFAADAAALAERTSKKIDVQGARNLQFSVLKTDDNFIFLGSPRSNPWVSLFENELDFRFEINKAGVDGIRNVRPRQDEQSLYVPTGGGASTRQSFAIIAFVQNPDQYGQVLLLAGISGEGTEAAGKLVTDLPRLSIQLRKCGISSPSPLRHFEMLLGVNAMAGSASDANVLACHILGDAAH